MTHYKNEVKDKKKNKLEQLKEKLIIWILDCNNISKI